MTSVWFDDLNLLLAGPEEEAAAIAADGFFFEVAGKDDGTELTNAEAIVSSVTSDLFDGASHEVTGWESASLPLRVQVVSPTPGGLAAGAARLIATCRKPGIRPLSFTLQDSAPTSVFDVLVATWVHQFDDLDSDLRHRRTYMLTLRCKPFARSDTPVSLPGLAVGGAYSETVVATGASTTGWSTTSRYVTRRNLALAPSFEHGTSYSPWVLSGGTSAAAIVSDVGAPFGSKVLRVTSKALDADPRSYMAVALVTVTPGQEVPITHRIKAGHSSQTVCGVFYRWYDGAGQQIGAGITSPTVPLTTSAFATVSTTATAPTGATGLRVYPFVEVDSPQPAGRIWYLDATAVIDLETVATTTFFDGDSPDAGGLTYYWGSTQGTSGVSIETDVCAVITDGTEVRPEGPSATAYPIAIPDLKADLTFVGSIDVTSHRYMRIRGEVFSSDVELNGILAQVVATGAGVKYIRVPDAIASTVTSVRIKHRSEHWGRAILTASEIATTSRPLAGTGRIISRSVSLVGSMPAEATIEVTNNGNPLGDHLVIYSGSSSVGFRALRALRTAGPAQTTAASSISGFTSTLVESITGGAGADTFDIPVNEVPEATYLLTAYLTGAGMTVDSPYGFAWQASIVEDPAGTPVEHSIVTGSTLIIGTATSFPGQPLDLGLVNLPPSWTGVTGTSEAVVRLKIWSTTMSSATWTLDEAWLTDVNNGQVSVVNFADAGLSGKVTALEVVPAAADRPQQQYLAYSGTAPNQTVREIIPTGWAGHRFDPADGDAQVSVVSDATTPGLSVAIEFYPRWDVYAAPIITDADPEA